MNIHDQLQDLAIKFIEDIIEKLPNPSLSEITTIKQKFIVELEEQFFAYKVRMGY